MEGNKNRKENEKLKKDRKKKEEILQYNTKRLWFLNLADTRNV